MVNGSGRKAAIFGGSFDPPHLGHQQIVQRALSRLDIDRLILLPAYLNPFKSSSLADPRQRLAWCRQLFGDIPGVLVSDYEVQQGRSVTTAESLRHFQQEWDVRYLIIGADNLPTLTQWHDFAWLNSRITWAIATRPGFALQTEMLRDWVVLEVEVPVSSSEIRCKKELTHIDTAIQNEVKEILHTKGNQIMTIDERIDRIVTLLDEKKAEEIEVFNLDEADYIADRVVIANSLNLKHTQALFDQLKEQLKPQGETFLHADMSDEWIVADLGDILIHIMIPEYRQRYSLERFLSELVESQRKEK